MDRPVSAPDREGLLDRVFHGSLVGMVVAGLDDGVVLEANETFCSLVGRGLGDVLGSSLDDLGLWGDLGPEAARDRLHGTGVIDGYDTTVSTMDGESRIVRVWAEVVDVGEPIVIIRASDVDGRAAARSRYLELREAELRYRALVEQIPAIIYTYVPDTEGDAERYDDYVSPQTTQILGYTPQEWLDHPGPMGTLVHPDDLPAVREEEERSFRTGRPFHAEYRMRRRDGQWVWILDEASVVRDADGRPLFMQGLMYDITERKEAEQRLLALDRLKNTLLHTLSHDLKEPLTAILGAASTLERLDDELDKETRADLLHTLVGRTRGMNSLLTDLLDLDRLDRGILEPRRFPVDLDGLIRELVERTDALGGRGIEIVSSRCIANVDATKVERMVENLLTNAVRHTPKGARIWVRTCCEPDGATIAVEDDGPGVPDEVKESIFEPFRRGPDTSQPGSGIGLSLVARFAELHGGRAWVQDREGGGASFRIFLPTGPGAP
jgi:PAS domain S-box-containing protein